MTAFYTQSETLSSFIAEAISDFRSLYLPNLQTFVKSTATSIPKCFVYLSRQSTTSFFRQTSSPGCAAAQSQHV